MKKYKNALKCFDKAIELRPEYAYALNNKGYTLYSLGKHKEALKYIDTSLKIDPSNVYAWRNKALNCILYLYVDTVVITSANSKHAAYCN